MIREMLHDVVLRFVSAVLLPPDHVLQLRAAPGSIPMLKSITSQRDSGPDGRGELICHVRGEGDELTTAIDQLGHSAIKNVQVLALGGNAAILPPHLFCGYEPNAGGRFR